MSPRRRPRSLSRSQPAGPGPRLTLEIDVGHVGLSSELAVDTVAEALRRVRRDPRLRLLKVIHGRGTGPRGGAIRREIRDWLRRRAPVRAVIDGEDYEIFDPDTQEMRAACGQHDDPDLGRRNAGVTVVWVC